MPKIRIVDDDVEFAENLAAQLAAAGHSVAVRHTLDGLVEDLQQDLPDLVILDVMFPENAAGGFDAARKIRRNPATRRLPVILLTGVNQEFPMDFSAEDIDANWMPVHDFVEKPPDMDALLAKIEKLVAPPA
jgi:CheY-like chemotaxis protein